MEIDIKKVLGEAPKNEFEAIESMNKAQQEVIAAFHIMNSAINHFDDLESLKIMKVRMIEYCNKFSKDEKCM